MVDLISNNQAQGEVANRLMQDGGLNIGLLKPFMWKNPKTGKIGVYATIQVGNDPKDPNNYRTVPLNTNATLRRDEWKQLDDAVVTIAEKQLIGIQDLVAAGLTYDLGNPLGTTQLEWHQMSDALEAEIDMNADARTQGDRVDFKYNYLPIPIVHVDYQLSKRSLEASRKLGNPLDTSMAERAVRKVNEKLENMLFTDSTYAFGTKDENNRNQIYSYINHPDRNVVTLSTYGNWDDSATTGGDIVKSVLAMIDAANAKWFNGPFQLYIPRNYQTAIEEDYDNTRGNTIRERIESIKQISNVKVIPTLPDDTVVLVQMTSDVVRLVRGMTVQNVEWPVGPGFTTRFKVMTIQVPQIRSDYNGKTGLVVMS